MSVSVPVMDDEVVVAGENISLWEGVVVLKLLLLLFEENISFWEDVGVLKCFKLLLSENISLWEV